jgi:hypothetical protein
MIAFVLAVAVAASDPGQGPATIDPGMSRTQVVAKLGEPMSTRNYEGHTYLLYKNGCERSCGMSDLVVLDSDKVVDAIFRSRGRKYSGTSSSPRMIAAADARRGPEKVAPPMKIAKPAKPEPAAAPAPKAPPTKPVEQAAPAQPKAAPQKAAIPEVIRPAPAKKPDDAKKPDTSKKAAPPPPKKPAS